MNTEQAIKQLTPIMDVAVREVEHNVNTRVVLQPDAVIFRPGNKGHTLTIGEAGMKAMSAFAGIPIGMKSDLAPDTYGHVATELLAKKEKYAVLVKDHTVVDFVKAGTLHPLNPERVLRTIEGTAQGVDFNKVVLYPSKVVGLEVVGVEEKPVVRGDMIRAGARVEFSPLGLTPPMVETYVLRLLCTNGMTGTSVLEQFKFTGGDSFWSWLRHSVKQAYKSLDGVVARYQELRNEAIPAAERAAALEAFIREARLSGPDADAIRARALAAPPENHFDLLNLMTWASSHAIADPVRARRAQLATSAWASRDTHARTCPVCHRGSNAN